MSPRAAFCLPFLPAVKCWACIPVLTLLWLWRNVKAIRLDAHWRQSGREAGQRGKKKKKKHSLRPSRRLTEACVQCAVLCGCVCVWGRAYRRSFLLRRKSFLVCAISASLGRGGKTCRETNHGVRDSGCQEWRCGWKWMEGKTQQSSSAKFWKKVFYWKQTNSGGVNPRKHLCCRTLSVAERGVVTAEVFLKWSWDRNMLSC